jgi:hypothetical protein
MRQEHNEGNEVRDISEEGDFDENEGYGNMLDEDGGDGLIGNGRLL